MTDQHFPFKISKLVFSNSCIISLSSLFKLWTSLLLFLTKVYLPVFQLCHKSETFVPSICLSPTIKLNSPLIKKIRSSSLSQQSYISSNYITSCSPTAVNSPAATQTNKEITSHFALTCFQPQFLSFLSNLQFRMSVEFTPVLFLTSATGTSGFVLHISALKCLYLKSHTSQLHGRR